MHLFTHFNWEHRTQAYPSYTPSRYVNDDWYWYQIIFVLCSLTLKVWYIYYSTFRSMQKLHEATSTFYKYTSQASNSNILKRYHSLCLFLFSITIINIMLCISQYPMNFLNSAKWYFNSILFWIMIILFI